MRFNSRDTYQLVQFCTGKGTTKRKGRTRSVRGADGNVRCARRLKRKSSIRLIEGFKAPAVTISFAAIIILKLTKYILFCHARNRLGKKMWLFNAAMGHLETQYIYQS